MTPNYEELKSISKFVGDIVRDELSLEAIEDVLIKKKKMFAEQKELKLDSHEPRNKLEMFLFENRVGLREFLAQSSIDLIIHQDGSVFSVRFFDVKGFDRFLNDIVDGMKIEPSSEGHLFLFDLSDEQRLNFKSVMNSSTSVQFDMFYDISSGNFSYNPRLADTVETSYDDNSYD